MQLLKLNKFTDGISCNDIGIQVNEFLDIIDEINAKNKIELEKTGYQCNNCNNDVIDTAYICSICQATIFCNDCEELNVHSHVLIKTSGKYVEELMNKLSSQKQSFRLTKKNLTTERMPEKRIGSVEDLPTLEKHFSAQSELNNEPEVTRQPSIKIYDNNCLKVGAPSDISPIGRSKSKDHRDDDIKSPFMETNDSHESINQRARMQSNLKKLKEHGFKDQQKNLKVLLECKYDFNKAMEALYIDSSK